MIGFSSDAHRLPKTGALIILFSLAFTAPAKAHVKWFCSYNVGEQPKLLEDVLQSDFGMLSMLSVALLLTGALIETTALGAALQQALDRVTGFVRRESETIIRATLGGFFVALWATGGIILTPELKTSNPIVSWLQLAIAAGMIWRPTMVFSAIGMAGLYVDGACDFGVFHMMDYPVFLGAAAFVALLGLGRSRLFGVRALDILRWAAAITLMWASVEKWAYPQWTYPLLVTHPDMAMGYDPDFFMTAAGVVEFTLAFALVWSPLCRRAAAIMLAGVFISAIGPFGTIDAIGHSGIIAVLAVIAADDRRVERPPTPVWAPFWYGAALAGFIAIYYAAHAAMFGTVLGLGA